MLEIRLGVAKVNQYASRESGDTLEVVERPHGGLSVVLVDGQGTGQGAKSLSNLVTAKAMTLLKEGARDGAVARAVHDYLHAFRHGKVSATLNILSIDLLSQTIVISRNNPCPAIIVRDGQVSALGGESTPIGIYHGTKPVVLELPVAPGTYTVVFTDGIQGAGRRYGDKLDAVELVSRLLAEGCAEPACLADRILEAALELDRGRAGDDMSVVVLGALQRDDETNVRRMTVSLPIPFRANG